MSTTSKTAALDFLDMVVAGRIREAYEKHIAPEFRHHNAWFRGDRESLLEAMEANHAQNPSKVIEVQRALEDGDLVAVHSRMLPAPGHKGVAVVHIFRFDGDKVVELWDLGVPVPEDCPNENGLF